MTTPWVIIGAGFAGASTAWALARAGAGPGLILERESVYGSHASGRNAGIVRLAEEDPIVRALAVRSLDSLRRFEHEGRLVLRSAGGLTIAAQVDADALAERHELLREASIQVELLRASSASSQFPFLNAFEFDLALWCPREGVVDVHALLTMYLEEARRGGFTFRPRTPVDELIVEAGQVKGVRTADREIRADVVIDASGAWAGRLGRPQALPLQPFRRHLCTTGPAAGWDRESPYVWVWENEFYCRPESGGLLMSPCDATPSPPLAPDVDPSAGEWLAAKLARHAPGLLDLPLRRTWACLRTFAPDHRPFIGPDPLLPGLYHVSGLGGFGMMTSAAIGEVAAATLLGRTLDWIDVASLSAARTGLAVEARS